MTTGDSAYFPVNSTLSTNPPLCLFYPSILSLVLILQFKGQTILYVNRISQNHEHILHLILVD